MTPLLFGLVALLTALLFALESVSFFRHDDWLILGNSVNFLTKNWSFLWSDTLFFSPHRADIWFFRPFFKLIVWGAHQLFGFQHARWVLFQWVLFLLAGFIGSKAITKNQNTRAGNLFLISLLSSFALSIGSLVWIGEGMMNVPQVFFLILSVFLFLQEARFAQFCALIAYLMALGFKESSAFLPLALAAIAITNQTWRAKQFSLIAFFAIFLGFLFFRLIVLDFNPAYLPQWNWKEILLPLVYTLGIIFLPLLALSLAGPLQKGLFDPQFWKSIRLFFPFLVFLILPYLGHPFFSPGWLLLPGFFSLWCFFYCLPQSFLTQVSPVKLTAFSLLLSSLPVFYQMQKIRRFEWGIPQRQIYQMIENLPPSTSKIWIETCGDSTRPDLSIQRVIGAEDHLAHLWFLIHPSQVEFKFFRCGEPSFRSGSTGISRLRWRFSDIELITQSD